MSDDSSSSPANVPPERPSQPPAGEQPTGLPPAPGQPPAGEPPHAPGETPPPERAPLEGVHLPADAILRGDVIRSDELFQGATEIHIVHCDVTYRLVITRSGKLVLRK